MSTRKTWAVFAPVSAIALAIVLACSACWFSAKSLVPRHRVVKSKHGVPIYFFPSPSIPLFQVDLVFDVGADDDPLGKSGLYSVSGAMLSKGIKGLDENQLAAKIDDLATDIDVSVGDERTVFSTYGLNEKAPEILKLFFNAINSPDFPKEPYERMKNNDVDALSQYPDSPEAFASHVIDLVLYNGTYKARPGSGLIADLKNLSLEDVRNGYSQLLRTDHLRVLVIGGKNRDLILKPVEEGLEKIRCPHCGEKIEPPAVPVYEAWKVPDDTVLLVQGPKISESHVRMGFLGPKRNVPEFYDLRMAETILSGYFGSRFNMVLREKLNLTYAIDAHFSFGDSTGTFLVSASTRNEKSGEMIRVCKEMLQDFVRNGPTEPEIQMAKDYLTGSFPLGLQSMFNVAEVYFYGLMAGLQNDFVDRYRERIRAVTKDSMMSAIRKYFLLQQMKVIVVGDPGAVGPKLRQSGLKYVVRDPKVFL